ncbi:MAG TPA: NUDIX domain-containing protein [Candidatus Saccharimonadia bacterium]|nr:NUDIX domain-containing protein [Candidatus Saccharimonadia bacterium]
MTRKLKYPLTRDEFNAIYGRVPRLTVEVVAHTSQGIILTQIAQGVLKGQWNLPGGTVYFGETLHQAVQRATQDELGIAATVGRLLGYIEYPNLRAAGYVGWPIGIAFEVSLAEGEEPSLSDQATALRPFAQLPLNTMEEQRVFLTSHYPALAAR